MRPRCPQAAPTDGQLNTRTTFEGGQPGLCEADILRRQSVDGGKEVGVLSQAHASGIAIIAWLVAVSLAAAAGGVFSAVRAWCRCREAERRLRSAERAVSEFCEALRARITEELQSLSSTRAADAHPARERSPVS